MADTLDSNGLTLETYNSILAFVQNSMNEIYATDGDLINFDSETPDGQFTNILAQISADARQLAAEIYNSFNPDNCQGTVQDQRYALNYITRKAGTFTIQNIDITVDRTVDLQGLDGDYNSLTATSYTVSDNAGNQWYLIDSTTLTTGTTSLPFRSQALGLVQPTIGTITNQVTKVLGVTNVINSVAPTTLGENEESDLEFRIRRNSSTAIYGQNNYDAMLGQLLQITGVTDARIFVNNTLNANTDVTDKVGGIPSRTVWVIVEGGANDDIASTIYQNSGGLPTIGDVTIDVPTTSQQIFTVNFDRVNPVPFYIQFDIKNTTGTPLTDVQIDNIKTQIVNSLDFGLGSPVETSAITEAAAQALLTYGSGLFALNVEISTDGTTWTDFINNASWQNKYVADVTRITITQA